MKVKGGARANPVFGRIELPAKDEVVLCNTPIDSAQALALSRIYAGRHVVVDSCGVKAIQIIPSAVQDAGEFDPCNVVLMNTLIPASHLLEQLVIALKFARPRVHMLIRVMDIFSDSGESIGKIRETIAEFAKRAPGIHFELQRWPDRRSLVPRPEGASFERGVLHDVMFSLVQSTANGTV